MSKMKVRIYLKYLAMTLLSVHFELVDAGGAFAGVLLGAGDEEAEVADADGVEGALYFVGLVAVKQVEGLPLFGEAVAALEEAAAGDVGAGLTACVDETP